MRTIKGRIMAAFITLALILSPFLIYLYQSLVTINASKNLREKIGILNVRQYQAILAFNEVWEFDIRKDSLYVNELTQNTTVFFKRIEESKKTLEEIRSFLPENKIVLRSYSDKIENHLLNLEQQVDDLIALQLKIGFKEHGLVGEMKEKIRQLEADSKNISLAEILSLRIQEKNFFLRFDKTYARELNAEVNQIKRRLEKQSTKNQNTLALLTEYQNLFNQIVGLDNQIGSESKGLFNEIRNSKQKLEASVLKLYFLVVEDSRLVNQSIKLDLILIFSLTAIFALVAAYFFSVRITDPLKEIIGDMEKIVKKSFEGKKKLETSSGLREIKKLTETYNKLIQKIHTQVDKLNDKNYKLNKLNFKLLESENELKEASKLKDKFFSIISHDLRNHTGNVLSLAQVLNSPNALSDKEKSVFTKYLMDSSQNLQLLLDNLLNWAKSQMNDHEISKRSFDISTLISQNITLFNENALRKGVKIAYEQNPHSKAYADKDMIDFVLRNLLSNALKFTTKGNSITFMVEESKNTLKVKVKDTGVGMKPEQVKKLTQTSGESFTTIGTDNEKGSGLGLSICKDFIKRNGGVFEIESELGKGTTFMFSVPTTLTKDAILSSV